MYVPRYQRGVSLWGWIAIVLLVVGAATVAVRLFGPIRDHLTLMSVVESVYNDQELREGPIGDVRQALGTRLTVNDVDYLKDEVVILRPGGKLAFQVYYEVEKPLFGNAYILLRFDEQVGP